jgi:hypothetical protein
VGTRRECNVTFTVIEYEYATDGCLLSLSIPA